MSLWGGVGVVRRVYTRNGVKDLGGDIELVCNEAVLCRGRGAAIHGSIFPSSVFVQMWVVIFYKEKTVRRGSIVVANSESVSKQKTAVLLLFIIN